ncbi:C-X-C motif chemokine 2-like [Parus major]|uniref:C-X-C motif chemokine 2-like n=1 Tax=Parus major TaxID=9157 RepID=UPI0008F4E074|nr:C-X-C motif chemokine 2-like [Parus major]
MRLLPAALALLLLLSCSVPGGGLSLESLLTNMRCKCIKSTAHVINLGLILTIDVTPPGIHCRRKEVILTLKKNRRVCVAPESPWIQLLIHKLMQRYVMPDTLAGASLPPDPPQIPFFPPTKSAGTAPKKRCLGRGGTHRAAGPLGDPPPSHCPDPRNPGSPIPRETAVTQPPCPETRWV